MSRHVLTDGVVVCVHGRSVTLHDAEERLLIAYDDGSATVAAPSRDLRLVSPHGSVVIEAAEDVRVVGDRVVVRGEREVEVRAPVVALLARRLTETVDHLAVTAVRYEIVARHLVERTEDTVREARGLLATTAARIRSTAHELMDLRSDRTVMRSIQETTIEAERILLG